MLAYSVKDRILYATDGCNSCVHHVSAELESLADDELKQFAAQNDIRPELLQHLAALLV